jgi:hypothetical protein
VKENKMATLGYGTVGSNRLTEAKAFYDALFASVGISSVFEHPSGGRIYGKGNALIFGVLSPYDGKPATVGNGSMFAFAFRTRAEVDTFHAQALKLGGKDEGPPGERGAGYYFSYFRDLDGNKLCAYNLG